MMHGFKRIAACVPELRVASPDWNAGKIAGLAKDADSKGACMAVFPELCVTGYTCGDLFHHDRLLKGSTKALERIAGAMDGSRLVFAVGAPLLADGRLYNCAFVFQGSKLLGIVPKSYIPNYREHYERRWFSSGLGLPLSEVKFLDWSVPFGQGLLFKGDGELTLGVELCEDLWAVIPPSSYLAVAGASIIVNLSASNAIVSKACYRNELVRQQSARCLAAYAYASAGVHESTCDLVFGGHSMIAENGAMLAEGERFQRKCTAIYADVDFERLAAARISESSYKESDPPCDMEFAQVGLAAMNPIKGAIERGYSPTPFVPSRKEDRDERCREIFHIQSSGLAKRLEHSRSERAVIGISGGLDSTLALLVAAETFRLLGRDPKGIVAVTMPGFGTSSRTFKNASALMKELGVVMRKVDIRKACMRHFSDIGHDPEKHDVTYENVQARERTQILMDMANREGGIVVGTGDLSEIALGWSTYNGDHMSMYAVNSGVPKTLIRYLIGWVAECAGGKLRRILEDIMDTPVSPELLPKSKDGEVSQKTEEILGSYELHDFYLYHTVKYGASPEKLKLLASLAFKGSHSVREMDRALGIFVKRFFSQQFKRNCMPDGPKVGTICLSPRGDWRMPSDASPDLWLDF